jgi:hypothetical protein
MRAAGEGGRGATQWARPPVQSKRPQRQMEQPCARWRRQLSRQPHLHDGRADRDAQELLHVRRERRAAADDELHVAAQARLDLGNARKGWDGGGVGWGGGGGGCAGARAPGHGGR